MLKKLCAVFAITASVGSFTTAAFAAPAGEFDYPELMVTPRSSERVTSEAAKESGSRWTSLVPVQISALATMTAGLIQMQGDIGTLKDVDSGKVGLITGSALLVGSFAIEALYSPYAAAAREIAAMPAKTPREQLLRERAAEEAIHAAARNYGRIRGLSVLANLGVNVYMMAEARSGTLPQAIDIIGAVFAFTPLVFGSRAEDIQREQENYKKRIYAPIASLTVATLSEPGTGRVAPGAAFRLSF